MTRYSDVRDHPLRWLPQEALDAVRRNLREVIETNDVRCEDDMIEPVADSMILALYEAGFAVRWDFNCKAFIRHGPGHQSKSECERSDPHDISGEHYAMSYPQIEWTGDEEYNDHGWA